MAWLSLKSDSLLCL